MPALRKILRDMGWNFPVPEAWDEIEDWYKTYMLVRAKKEQRGKKGHTDTVIPHKSSLHYTLKEKRTQEKELLQKYIKKFEKRANTNESFAEIIRKDYALSESMETILLWDAKYMDTNDHVPIGNLSDPKKIIPRLKTIWHERFAAQKMQTGSHNAEKTELANRSGITGEEHFERFLKRQERFHKKQGKMRQIKQGLIEAIMTDRDISAFLIRHQQNQTDIIIEDDFFERIKAQAMRQKNLRKKAKEKCKNSAALEKKLQQYIQSAGDHALLYLLALRNPALRELLTAKKIGNGQFDESLLQQDNPYLQILIDDEIRKRKPSEQYARLFPSTVEKDSMLRELLWDTIDQDIQTTVKEVNALDADKNSLYETLDEKIQTLITNYSALFSEPSSKAKIEKYVIYLKKWHVRQISHTDTIEQIIDDHIEQQREKVWYILEKSSNQKDEKKGIKDLKDALKKHIQETLIPDYKTKMASATGYEKAEYTRLIEDALFIAEHRFDTMFSEEEEKFETAARKPLDALTFGKHTSKFSKDIANCVKLMDNEAVELEKKKYTKLYKKRLSDAIETSTSYRKKMLWQSWESENDKRLEQAMDARIDACILKVHNEVTKQCDGKAKDLINAYQTEAETYLEQPQKERTKSPQALEEKYAKQHDAALQQQAENTQQNKYYFRKAWEELRQTTPETFRKKLKPNANLENRMQAIDALDKMEKIVTDPPIRLHWLFRWLEPLINFFSDKTVDIGLEKNVQDMRALFAHGQQRTSTQTVMQNLHAQQLEEMITRVNHMSGKSLFRFQMFRPGLTAVQELVQQPAAIKISPPPDTHESPHKQKDREQMDNDHYQPNNPSGMWPPPTKEETLDQVLKFINEIKI